MLSTLPSRKRLRLKEYDYTQAGAYFVTICTHMRSCLFGQVRDDEMLLSPAGLIVEQELLRSPLVRPTLQLDEFVVMPNHLHFIAVFAPEEERTDQPLVPTGKVAPTLGNFLAQFKSIATKRMQAELKMTTGQIWQRGYYDHVIRDDEDLNRIRQYIIENPLAWALDTENPQARTPSPLDSSRVPGTP